MSDEELLAAFNESYDPDTITQSELQAGEDKYDAVFRLSLRAVAAKAWDEGFDHASDDIGRAEVMREFGENENPYDIPTTPEGEQDA